MKKHLNAIQKSVKAGIGKVALKFTRIRQDAFGVKTDFPLIDLKMKHRLMAAISYLNILVLVPLVLSKKHSFVAFHARQGLALAVVWAVGILLFWLPVLGWLVVFFTLVEIIIGFVNVCRGKEKPLPLIGKYAIER